MDALPLPPCHVPFPVAERYTIRPDLNIMGALAQHIDDPGANTLVRFDDASPRALAHTLHELEAEPDAVRFADPTVAAARWWSVAHAIASAISREGDPRVQVDAAGSLYFPFLGVRVHEDGRMDVSEAAAHTPTALRPLAARAQAQLRRFPDATRALDALRLAVSEDLVVLLRETAATSGNRVPSGGRTAYILVAAPSGWDPAARANADFATLHMPVPNAGALVSAASAISDAMIQRGPFVRYVWGFSALDTLSHHPRRHPAAPLQGLHPQDWFLRVERQTTMPMPAHDAAMFAIRVYVQPLAQALREPGRAARVQAAVASMDPAVLAYKGLTSARDDLLAYLSSVAR